jgi:hypothetical protein
MTREQVLERYFLEHRAALLDLAAFLDRIDRAQPDDEPGETYRETALRRAIEVLDDGEGERARRVQEVLSDPTDEPYAGVNDTGATNGAYHGGAGA